MSENAINNNNNDSTLLIANIAVIGAGWWSQGWHLPALHHNNGVNLAAIVDTNDHPKSNLNPDLESLETLKEKYNTRIFKSVEDLLSSDIGPTLDGVLVATPHATHYAIGCTIMEENNRRKGKKPLHILMEKPMTTDIQDAFKMVELAIKAPKDNDDDNGTTATTTTTTTTTTPPQIWINHSANYRKQTYLARKAIQEGKLGTLRHVVGSFSSPLTWIFDDPANKGWNEPSGNMLGNGFAWGQSSHLIAWIFQVCPDLCPEQVYCNMTHSIATGADVSHSATITCSNSSAGSDSNDKSTTTSSSSLLVVMNISGTSLLPGNAHSEPPVGKQIRLEFYGTNGSLHYSGDDRLTDSGQLEFRDNHGTVHVLDPKFEFENLDSEGLGPESLQEFIKLCRGAPLPDVIGANVFCGLKAIQTIDAMYKSDHYKNIAQVVKEI